VTDRQTDRQTRCRSICGTIIAWRDRKQTDEQTDR